MALPIPSEILSRKKLSFDEIKDLVQKCGFGTTLFLHKGITYGTSHGIQYALISKSIPRTEIETAIDRFLSGDWGSFYEPGEHVCPGHEYGQYPSALGSETHNGSIMIHREPNPVFPWNVVVYFQFER